MKLIGTFSETRPTCGVRHIPTTFSPWLDQTWCICGKHQWPGIKAPLTKYKWIYDHAGQGAKLLGWDVYELEVVL